MKLKLGEDLKVTKYQNGDPIPLALSKKQWKEFGEKGIGAYCINKNGNYLYNWYAVNDNRGLAPKGWHIPTEEEWDSLKEELKQNPSYAGYRNGSTGNYTNMGYNSYIWSSTEASSRSVWSRRLNFGSSEVNRGNYSKRSGLSVRCIKRT